MRGNRCDRCGGPLLTNYSEIACLHCGHVPEDEYVPAEILRTLARGRRNFPEPQVRFLRRGTDGQRTARHA